MNAIATQIYNELVEEFGLNNQPIYRDGFATDNSYAQVLMTSADGVSVDWQFRLAGEPEWQRVEDPIQDNVTAKIAELLAV